MRSKMKHLGLKSLLLLMMLMGALSAQAAGKPFAEHKVVLQISDADPSKQDLVLNVANNLVKAYGADKVDIEIVAFGPGIRLMFDDNSHKGRIKGLADSAEVGFTACSNTIQGVSKKLGHAPVINPVAKTDSPGIVRIMALVKDGYTLVKP